MRQLRRQHALHTLLALRPLHAPFSAALSAPRHCPRVPAKLAWLLSICLLKTKSGGAGVNVAYLHQGILLLLLGGRRAAVCCCECRHSRGGQESPQQALLAGGAQLQAEALTALLRVSGSWGQLLGVKSSCCMQQVPWRSHAQALLCPSGLLLSV